MDGAALDPAVKQLRDCWERLSEEQARLRRASDRLEQRVRDLELHFSDCFTAEARSVLDRSLPPQLCEPPGLAGAALPTGALDSCGAAGGDAAREPEDEAQGEGREDALLVEHSLGETLWDGAVLAGLPQLTRGGSRLLLASSFLNVAVQTYLCAVLLSSEDFMQQRRYRDLQAPMREFRFSSAHDLKHVDARGRSLASRVCGDDRTLFLAATQADTLTEINAYLAMEPGDLHLKRFGTGPLLCGVCIFIFAAAVLRELRSVAASTRAVCALPRGSHTRLDGGRLAALWTGRLACILLNNALRVGIAIMLLCTGIIWLSSTTSITDLVLNTAALCFVMDVDECLFQTTVPDSVHTLVRGLEPLTYRRSRWTLEAILPLMAIIGATVLCGLLLIQPNVADMLAVKQALCAGNLEFTATMNTVGVVIAHRTAAYDGELSPSLMESAVEELVLSRELGKASAPQFSQLSLTPASFQTWIGFDFAAFGRRWECVDGDVAYGGDIMKLYPGYFTAVRYATGLHAGVSLLERPFACLDYAAYCQTVNILRSMCPVTCGCDDPTSGLFRPQPGEGCPEKCQAVRLRHLQSRPCVDMSVANSSQWRSYWAAATKRMFPPTSDESRQRQWTGIVARKVAQGCSNDETLAIIRNISNCDEGSLWYTNGFSSVVAFCAAKCCKGPAQHPECPTSCSASAGNATHGLRETGTT